MLASPYALHLPSYYDTILAGGNLSHFVTEWAPTTLSASTAPVYLLILAGVYFLGIFCWPFIDSEQPLEA